MPISDLSESIRQKKREPIDSLIQKINQLPDGARAEFAQACGTSLGNLRQIAYGFGGCSPLLARRIVENSGCDVTFEQLIPELAMA